MNSTVKKATIVSAPVSQYRTPAIHTYGIASSHWDKRAPLRDVLGVIDVQTHGIVHRRARIGHQVHVGEHAVVPTCRPYEVFEGASWPAAGEQHREEAVDTDSSRATNGRVLDLSPNREAARQAGKAAPGFTQEDLAA